MSYNFDIIGISPVLQFFNHQQRLETHPNRSQAYLGSYSFTLDALIEATQSIHRRPNWDWDAIVGKMVEFWLSQEDDVRHWKSQFEAVQGGDNLIVARVINYDSLRHELETQFGD